MKIKVLIFLVIGIVLGGLFTTLFFQPSKENGKAGIPIEKEPGESIKYWTCSMHPQIHLPKPGKCPICAMDLIPVTNEANDEDETHSVSLQLSKTAQELAEVKTTMVKRQEVSHKLRLVGKVAYDESKLAYISAWVAGRIDRLFVDFTGTKVKKGDHLISLYSPELYAAQSEYLQALSAFEKMKDSSMELARQNAQATLKSVTEKLRLYGLTVKQIEETTDTGKPSDHMTIYSPISGTVIHKNGFEGMYVKTGEKIYTIADLSRVWILLEAYERDISWIHYGQKIVIETESYPGEYFYGKVGFIEPFMDEKTRTIQIRVNVDNMHEKLKPGMFVRGILVATIYRDGKIYEKDMAGKWICPMHPDIVKDVSGTCDECGMALVPTAEFGFAEEPVEREIPIVIPKTAPLITGKRAVVYVEKPGAKDSSKRYVLREVVLGPLAGDFYVVISGVSEGEKVVTSGNFKIDSALQILNRPSMMNPQEEKVMEALPDTHETKGSQERHDMLDMKGSHAVHEMKEPEINEKETVEEQSGAHMDPNMKGSHRHQ